jgi:hypothetical protein
MHAYQRIYIHAYLHTNKLANEQTTKLTDKHPHTHTYTSMHNYTYMQTCTCYKHTQANTDYDDHDADDCYDIYLYIYIDMDDEDDDDLDNYNNISTRNNCQHREFYPRDSYDERDDRNDTDNDDREHRNQYLYRCNMSGNNADRRCELGISLSQSIRTCKCPILKQNTCTGILMKQSKRVQATGELSAS